MKLAVAGCPRNCSEAMVKDVGVVAVGDDRWEIYIGGAAGASVRKGDVLATVDGRAEAMRLTGVFMQYYRENAKLAGAHLRLRAAGRARASCRRCWSRTATGSSPGLEERMQDGGRRLRGPVAGGSVARPRPASSPTRCRCPAAPGAGARRVVVPGRRDPAECRSRHEGRDGMTVTNPRWRDAAPSVAPAGAGRGDPGRGRGGRSRPGTTRSRCSGCGTARCARPRPGARTPAARSPTGSSTRAGSSARCTCAPSRSPTARAPRAKASGSNGPRGGRRDRRRPLTASFRSQHGESRFEDVVPLPGHALSEVEARSGGRPDRLPSSQRGESKTRRTENGDSPLSLRRVVRQRSATRPGGPRSPRSGRPSPRLWPRAGRRPGPRGRRRGRSRRSTVRQSAARPTG